MAWEKVAVLAGGGGAGTFLMEHMPKSTQRVGGCIS